MVGLTSDETRSALAAMELQCEDRRLSFCGAVGSQVRVAFKMQEPHQVLYLARLVAHLGYEEIYFNGARLWLTTWDVWNPLEEAIAFKTFEQFRRSYGENRSLESAPGTYFRHDEFVESVCCLLQPMLVGWDAYYVPTWTHGQLDYFVSVSHDSFVEIHVRTQEMYGKCVEILGAHDWITPLMK